MKLHARVCVPVLLCCLTVFAPAAFTQTASGIQLYGSVDVRLSQSSATYTTPVTFNQNTLTLSCPSAPIATLSGTADGTGNVLVDNNIFVTSTTKATTNICQGGKTEHYKGQAFPDCFTSSYQKPASNGLLNGVDVDNADYPGTTTVIVTTGGVPPMDVSSFLTSGTQQLTVALEDEGGYVASSNVYLYTNCSLLGIQNGGSISGNPIAPSSQTSQDFSFNPITNQQIGFTYDLGTAYANNTVVANSNGSIPQVADAGLPPGQFSSLVTGTPFATSSCLVHSGELVNGLPACKLYTLVCSVGTSNSAAGANCPVSSQANEVLNDSFDGPSFTLTDIPVPNGPVFHEGIGLLMASEGWAGGACQFDPASGLQDVVCPQNLLTSFSGPGAFSSSGTTTHPNSTFITVVGVPEPLTTVIPTDTSGNPVSLGPGNWTNNPNPNVVFSMQSPYLTGTNLPNASTFVAAPIRSISYGIAPAAQLPVPGGATTSGSYANPSGCPAQLTPSAQPLPAVKTPVETFSGQTDGNYLIYYSAQDCAGTQELKFAQDATGSWSTNFYTFPLNVDTIAPEVTNLALTPASPYYQGQVVTATYSCSDAALPSGGPASGVVSCGSQTFGGGVASAGPYTVPVNTSVGGTQNFTVQTADAAGNTSSQSATYAVNIDSQIQLSLSSNTVTYPGGPKVNVKVLNLYGRVPTGTVLIIDNGKPIATLTLRYGCASYYLGKLSAGKHSLNAQYLGDASNPSGYSAAAQLTVLPAPVRLTAACSSTSFTYGQNFQCNVEAEIGDDGAPQGVVTYSLDGAAPVSVPLVYDDATILITSSPVGTHTLVISYPAQTNYSAAGPIVESFTVTPAP
ncbi:MAG: Ig-like domain-containing protein [Terracidiphilus sp.]